MGRLACILFSDGSHLRNYCIHANDPEIIMYNPARSVRPARILVISMRKHSFDSVGHANEPHSAGLVDLLRFLERLVGVQLLFLFHIVARDVLVPMPDDAFDNLLGRHVVVCRWWSGWGIRKFQWLVVVLARRKIVVEDRKLTRHNRLENAQTLWQSVRIRVVHIGGNGRRAVAHHVDLEVLNQVGGHRVRSTEYDFVHVLEKKGTQF